MAHPSRGVIRFCFYGGFSNFWCPGEDSNLHGLLHTDLNRARLPVPPPGHSIGRRGCISPDRWRQRRIPQTSTNQLARFCAALLQDQARGRTASVPHRPERNHIARALSPNRQEEFKIPGKLHRLASRKPPTDPLIRPRPPELLGVSLPCCARLARSPGPSPSPWQTVPSPAPAPISPSRSPALPGPTPDEGEEDHVHFALVRTGETTLHAEKAFGPLGRDSIREACLTTMLSLLEEALD